MKSEELTIAPENKIWASSEELTITPENKIWASIERTIQVDQFEPIKIIVGEIYTLGPKDNPGEIRGKITQRLICEAMQEGENVRRNPEQYINEDSPEVKTVEESTAAAEQTGRRRRHIE